MSATREEVAKGLAEELGYSEILSDGIWIAYGGYAAPKRIVDALISREMELIELRGRVASLEKELWEAAECIKKNG